MALASSLTFSPYPLLNSRALPPTFFHFINGAPSKISPLSVSSTSNPLKLKLRRTFRVSSEGAPNELVEDSKFVPLNADDPRYGPPALLLLGFELEEAVKIQELLKDLDGEFMQVILCTEDMITQSLWEAVHTNQPVLAKVKIARSLPRICFLSGLSGEEMMMFIDAFPETGLEPAVFAALVPNAANKPVEELIEEIMGDHEALTGAASERP
ncbi:uncharacterized protein LOC120080918 isoform X2 [Benincasa hispida]|uniref:uncharacterized protein LOC120080918 isoform X2 n=1 Tax=Benincasa hispida TaxID=102211 RepID=UPI0018FFC7AA|nr:uncharacterized protein LOC120080918 isoform X2 [Benincasa hispida]